MLQKLCLDPDFWALLEFMIIRLVCVAFSIKNFNRLFLDFANLKALYSNSPY